ncbi:hypothetical protein C1N81_36585 [Streptomyces sp. SGAir0957]
MALTFGTLLSSQGTDASFVLTRETLSRLSSGRFPSVLLSCVSDSIRSLRSDFLGGFAFYRSCFRNSAFRGLPSAIPNSISVFPAL